MSFLANSLKLAKVYFLTLSISYYITYFREKVKKVKEKFELNDPYFSRLIQTIG